MFDLIDELLDLIDGLFRFVIVVVVIGVFLYALGPTMLENLKLAFLS